MNKTEFSDLINYIKNRPTERMRLLQALQLENNAAAQSTFDFTREECPVPSAEPQGEQWVTCSHVAKVLNVSSRWVRDRLCLLPPKTVIKRNGVLGAWMVNYPAVKDQLYQLLIQ